jgi:DNA-binding transcriptional ArsR family regulator
MRKALPVITEDVEPLKQRLQRERDGRKKPRLQMLYLLASGQAQTRRDVAQLLGVHRNTIGHWLALYEAGGLEALLEVSIPAGKPLSPPRMCWLRLRRLSGRRPGLPPLYRHSRRLWHWR